MKKLGLIIGCLFLILATGCCAPHHCRGAQKEFRVLASTFPIYLFALNVCENAPNVAVELLVPAHAGCPHDFSLRPMDLRKLTQAGCLAVNGAGLEDFLARPLQSAAPSLPVIDCATGIALLDDAGHGKNPHIFAAPRQAARMAENLAKGLAALNPENAAIYEANAKKYCAALLALSQKLERVGQKAANKKIALEHDALAYLAQNAGLEIVALFEDGSSAAQLTALEKELKEKQPAFLAGDSQFSRRLLETLSRETGLPFILLDPCASGPDDAGAGYYLQVMENNLHILEAHFDK